MEHRHGHRTAVDVEVTVRTRAGLIGSGRINEASASGARLEISLPLTVHTVISLTLVRHHTPGPRRLKLEAEVVRRTDRGFGIEWTEFMPWLLNTLTSGTTTASSHKTPETRAVVGQPRRKARPT
jgi:hypothetical protein